MTKRDKSCITYQPVCACAQMHNRLIYTQCHREVTTFPEFTVCLKSKLFRECTHGKWELFVYTQKINIVVGRKFVP